MIIENKFAQDVQAGMRIIENERHWRVDSVTHTEGVPGVPPRLDWEKSTSGEMLPIPFVGVAAIPETHVYVCASIEEDEETPVEQCDFAHITGALVQFVRED